MRIFHIARAADWEAAGATGRYAVSTLGRSLADEGFIHASRGDQWQRIRDLVYADVTDPLVLLTIDTDLLDAPVVEEAPAGSGPPGDRFETFPHIYGVLNTNAVVNAIALEPTGEAVTASDPTSGTPSFSRLFLEEIMFRAAIGLGVMVLAGTAGLIAQLVYGDAVALPVALLALVVGLLGAVVLTRRRDRALRR